MDEKEKESQEKSKQEQEEVARKSAEDLAKKNSSDGVSDETGKTQPNAIDKAREENDRTESLNKERREILDREEKLHAEQMVTGRGQMVQQPAAKKMTSIEYAEAYEKGEVDPYNDTERGNYE